MRFPRVDRRHGALVGVLVAFGVLSLAIRGVDAGGETEGEGIPSIEHRGPLGLRALYLACDSLGLPVGPCRRAPSRLDPEVHALIVIGGAMEAPADRAGLAEWVEGGGRLLVGDVGAPPNGGNAAAFARVLPLPGKVEVRADGESGEGGAGGWGLPVIPGFASRVLDPESLPRGATVLVRAGKGEEARPWIASWRQGAGEVVVLAEAGFLTNEGLGHPGAGLLAVRLLERLGRGEEVEFLESIHGYEEMPSPFAGPTRAMLSTTAGHITLQLGAAALLLLFAGAPRFGRVRRVLMPPRRSEEEHVDAVAGLLVAAGAWEEVGKLCLQGFRRRLGLPPAAAGAPVARDLVAVFAWRDPAAAAELKTALGNIRRGAGPGTMIPALRFVEEHMTRAVRGGPSSGARGGG